MFWTDSNMSRMILKGVQMYRVRIEKISPPSHENLNIWTIALRMVAKIWEIVKDKLMYDMFMQNYFLLYPHPVDVFLSAFGMHPPKDLALY